MNYNVSRKTERECMRIIGIGKSAAKTLQIVVRRATRKVHRLSRTWEYLHERGNSVHPLEGEDIVSSSVKAVAGV